MFTIPIRLFTMSDLSVHNGRNAHQVPQALGTLNSGQLRTIAEAASCKVHGWKQAGNDAHRFVVGSVIRAFNHPRATVLCEPSLVSNTMNPPDVVLVDEEAGVCVIEVKGVGIESILDVLPGGEMVIQYSTGPTTKSVILQARKAMFAIKNVVDLNATEEVDLCFNYWVHFPRIRRSEWRWSFQPPELLFQDDCHRLGEILRERGAMRLKKKGLDFWSEAELGLVMKAFGDNAVLYPREDRRPVRKAPFGTLGELFDSAALAYKNLSGEQQALSEEVWEEGPRLIRGVAGSGKTIVLASNLARRIERIIGTTQNFLDPAGHRVRIGVFCFNRTLVPFLREKIERAYKQRTGRDLGDEVDLTVCILNDLYWQWSEKQMPNAPWPYLSLVEAKAKAPTDDGEVSAMRAEHCLSHLMRFKAQRPAEYASLCFDTVYVDEGQDLHPMEIQLLSHVCKRHGDAEPNLIIFYDDAQNLYGRPRPNWKELGLTLTGGRSTIMTQCHRNPRRVIESAFNVLYGTCADSGAKKPPREFGDIYTLESKNLIRQDGQLWRIAFAVREGAQAPHVTYSESWAAEKAALLKRLLWLVSEQNVRPQDILVLSAHKKRLDELEEFLRSSAGSQGWSVQNATKAKDVMLGSENRLTLSTVHSAKGYDAYAVLIVAANEFEDSVEGRALFYVGCTRALEVLEVSGHREHGLHRELEIAVQRLGVYDDRGQPRQVQERKPTSDASDRRSRVSGKSDVAILLKEMGRRCLFHFTDQRNLTSIKKHGLLAYRELVSRGLGPIYPGSDEASRASDVRKGLDKYVHLCFGEDHPMASKAQAAGRIGSVWFVRVASEVMLTPGAMGCAVASNRADARVLPLAEALEQMRRELILGGRVAAAAQGRLTDYDEVRKYEVLIPREISVRDIIMDF